MKTTSILGPCGLAILIVACSSTRPGPVGSAGSHPERGEDAALAARLAQIHRGTIREGDARYVDLVLKNTSAERVDAFFTVDWLDAAGRPLVLGSGGWSPLVLDAGASQPVRIQAMPQDAAGWRLRFSSKESAR